MLALANQASAQLFADDFDVDHTANWAVNKSGNPAGNTANFFFDYSTVGIPSAPGSIGGSTLGLRLAANSSGNVFGGLSVSPLGQSFTGDYHLHFYMWMNYQAGPGGSINLGGNGTTQGGGAGIGTAGTTAQWAGGAHDSLHFSMTGDGGSAQDYRVYRAASISLASSGYYNAGTVSTPTDARNDNFPYYSSLGAKTAPSAQITLFPEQTGTTRAGASGFAWRDVWVSKLGNIVTWKMDGLVIATVDITGAALGGNNILFDYYDTNSSSSTDASAAALLFGLIDNVTVVPEPSTVVMAVLGGVGLFFAARRRK